MITFFIFTEERVGIQLVLICTVAFFHTLIMAFTTTFRQDLLPLELLGLYVPFLIINFVYSFFKLDSLIYCGFMIAFLNYYYYREFLRKMPSIWILLRFIFCITFIYAIVTLLVNAGFKLLSTYVFLYTMFIIGFPFLFIIMITNYIRELYPETFVGCSLVIFDVNKDISIKELLRFMSNPLETCFDKVKCHKFKVNKYIEKSYLENLTLIGGNIDIECIYHKPCLYIKGIKLNISPTGHFEEHTEKYMHYMDNDVLLINDSLYVYKRSKLFDPIANTFVDINDVFDKSKHMIIYRVSLGERVLSYFGFISISVYGRLSVKNNAAKVCLLISTHFFGKKIPSILTYIIAKRICKALQSRFNITAKTLWYQRESIFDKTFPYLNEIFKILYGIKTESIDEKTMELLESIVEEENEIIENYYKNKLKQANTILFAILTLLSPFIFSPLIPF